MSQRKEGKEKRRVAAPPALPRKYLSDNLHRRACQWDILIHQLATALMRRYWYMQPRLAADTFRFDNDELPTLGMVLAKGFELFVSHNGVSQLKGDEPGLSLWDMGEGELDSFIQMVLAECFDPLLRKCVEDVNAVYPNRHHRDLPVLLDRLGETLRQFLLTHCLPGSELHRCITDPLASDEGYFADNGKPVDPAESSGNPALDVYRLGVLVHDADDVEAIKEKLVHFTTTDPWIFFENMIHIARAITEEGEKNSKPDIGLALINATDSFLFSATHLAGKTPVRIFLERQLFASERQKARLERWDREVFSGTFLIQSVQSPFVELQDLMSGKNFRTRATEPKVLSQFYIGDLLQTRLVPWDDHWLFSGAQMIYKNPGDRGLAQLRSTMDPVKFGRYIDNDDPRIKHAFEIQHAQYDQWLKLFGSDEVFFDDGKDVSPALNRFYYYWTHEHIIPEKGLTPAQAYEQAHGKAIPPLPDLELAEEILDSDDVAIVFERDFGITFLDGYREFVSAFETDAPLSESQQAIVWEYLQEPGIEPCVFFRMRERFPQHMESVMRQALNDDQFEMGRDFEAILGHFKGEQMRRPVRPMISVANMPG